LPEKPPRTMPSGPAGEALVVLLKPLLHIVSGADVEALGALAPQHVNEGHGGVLPEKEEGRPHGPAL